MNDSAGRRGVAVVSIDTELAWGRVHRRDGVDRRRDDAGERSVVPHLLELLERHAVPATWAVVGHLHLDRCDAVDGLAHPELPRPEYPWLRGDWFAVDPCTDLVDAPGYYGADIVAAIRAATPAHELASHSFSHLIAEGCSPDVFCADLGACRRVAGGDGLRSFVYPRNEIAHVELLAAEGFLAYRGRSAPPRRSSVARVADAIRAGRGEPVRPTRHPSGVWNVPQTYLLAPATRLHRLPVRWWTQLPMARLAQAAREASLFHLWFHPSNLSRAPGRALPALDRLLGAMARWRDQDRLDVLTMGAYAERLETAHATSLAAEGATYPLADAVDLPPGEADGGADAGPR